MRDAPPAGGIWGKMRLFAALVFVWGFGAQRGAGILRGLAGEWGAGRGYATDWCGAVVLVFAGYQGCVAWGLWVICSFLAGPQNPVPVCARLCSCPVLDDHASGL